MADKELGFTRNEVITIYKYIKGVKLQANTQNVATGVLPDNELVSLLVVTDIKNKIREYLK